MISRISQIYSKTPGSSVNISGWVRALRQQKNFSFIDVDDGSGNIQVVFATEKTLHVVTGASVNISGEIVETPKSIEIQGSNLEVIGPSDVVIFTQKYPLAKKRHTMEHLRDTVHFRPRTQTIASSLKIRSEASYAIHSFFRKEGEKKLGFYYIHTPVITGNDCEGAGEMFELKNSEDFFGKKAFLTVSGQLHAEIFALSLGRVYTFGPTFRAEKSHTQRHLAEFWMVLVMQIEPEMINFSLENTYFLCKNLIQHTIKHVLENNSKDLGLLSSPVDKLNDVLEKEWKIITYSEAKSITKKQEEGLSTEEERFLTVVSSQDNYFEAPVIVTNYPENITPFYMKKKSGFAENFDLLFPGVGEVTGGSVREENYEKLEGKVPDKIGLEWYLDLRKYGTMPHAGFGLGFERLLSFITGLNNVRDIIPIPRTPKNLLCQANLNFYNIIYLYTYTIYKMERKLVASPSRCLEILIPDKTNFAQKLQEFFKDGISKLEIFMDFDFTVSKRKVDDIRVQSTYEMLQSSVLDEVSEKKIRELYNHYHPIEIDMTIPKNEKEKFMNDWWELSNKEILDKGFLKKDLKSFILNSHFFLRHGFDIFLNKCLEFEVPVSVISGGIGNLVETALEELVDPGRVKVYSNFIEFDSDGRSARIAEPGVRSDKSLALQGVECRDNIIMIGDLPAVFSTQDVHTIDSLQYKNSLKIGFFNTDAYDLSSFTSAYDVLILNDGDFSFLNTIFDSISQSSSASWTRSLEETLAFLENLS